MLAVVVAPTVEPVTLLDVKEHLRVTHDDQDILIDSYISAAREAIELHTGRALAAGTYRWVSEQDIGPINYLPFWPVASVTAVEYEDAGVRQALTDYTFDGDRSAVALSVPYGRALTVTFTTVAGPLPAALRAAIYLMVSDLYEQGGSVIVGVSVANNPTVDRLIQPHRLNLGV